MTYKVVDQTQFPDWLPSSLTNKFNSAVMAASGNSVTYVAIFMGFRIDHNQIDEHPFVVAFGKDNGSEFSGLIEHGNWDGRSTTIPPEMERLISASGFSTHISFGRKPEVSTGTLEDLKSQGILNGYEQAVNIIEKVRKENNAL